MVASSTVRTRAGGSRSRLGCATCRQRRLKCDESKPGCKRCASSGYKCDFETSLTPGTSDSLTFIYYAAGPPRGISQPDCEFPERRALDFFIHRAIPDIRGESSSDLWSKYLLPLVYHEPAIKYAVAALATLYEDYVNYSIDESESALVLYGKAINLISKLDPFSQGAVDIALGSCVLFASFEGLSKHPRSLISHVLSGTRILGDEALSRQSFIPRVLVKSIFRGLITQALQIGDNDVVRQDRSEDYLSIPDSFATIEEASVCLDEFEHYTLHQVRDAALAVEKETPYTEFVVRFENVVARNKRLTRRWRSAAAKFLAAEGDSLSPTHLRLKVIDTSFSIGMGSVGECDFDRYMDEFKQIVDWSELYLKALAAPVADQNTMWRESTPRSNTTPASTPSPTPSDHSQPSQKLRPRPLMPKPEMRLCPTFSVSAGVILRLQMVALKCRDPLIRRRALRLIQISNRREGLLDSQIVGKFAERIISIEEEQALRILRSDGHDIQQLTGAAQVPLQARVEVRGVQLGLHKQGEVSYIIQDPAGMARAVTETMSW
ncbi:hypothetical protein LTR67_008959 [Exophiala xenobiotica]